MATVIFMDRSGVAIILFPSSVYGARKAVFNKSKQSGRDDMIYGDSISREPRPLCPALVSTSSLRNNVRAGARLCLYKLRDAGSRNGIKISRGQLQDGTFRLKSSRDGFLSG